MNWKDYFRKLVHVAQELQNKQEQERKLKQQNRPIEREQGVLKEKIIDGCS